MNKTINVVGVDYGINDIVDACIKINTKTRHNFLFLTVKNGEKIIIKKRTKREILETLKYLSSNMNNTILISNNLIFIDDIYDVYVKKQKNRTKTSLCFTLKNNNVISINYKDKYQLNKDIEILLNKVKELVYIKDTIVYLKNVKFISTCQDQHFNYIVIQYKNNQIKRLKFKTKAEFIDNLLCITNKMIKKQYLLIKKTDKSVDYMFFKNSDLALKQMKTELKSVLKQTTVCSGSQIDVLSFYKCNDFGFSKDFAWVKNNSSVIEWEIKEI